MPRANRYVVPGQIYHLTHRCHDRSFLLKFARDRTAYRQKLWEGLRQFQVALLNYGLTSNHVAFRNNLEVALMEAMEKNEMARDPRWTESIAVGSKEYVGKMEGRIDGRQELEVSEERGVWVLKEEMLKMKVRGRKSNLKPFFDLQIDATD